MVAETELRIKVAADTRNIGGIKQVEASIKKVREETDKATRLAGLLAQEYKLTDKEAAQVAAELKRVQQETKKTQKLAGGLADVFKGIAQGVGQELTSQGVRALQSAISGVIGVVGQATDEYKSFEAALTSFDAKSDASAEQIERIGEQATELASITSQTPASVAALSTALLSLGATADEVEDNLGGITKLSDVLKEDPVITGRVVQTGLNIFGEFGETADSLADKLTFLANNSAATAAGGIEELFQLFSKTGGLVGATGAEFDDLAATFGVLIDGGASAEVAATGIKSALTSLAAPTSEANEELKKLGVSAFDSEGEFRGLGATLDDFVGAFETLNAQEQIQVADKVFGRAGATAFLTALDKSSTALKDLREGLGTKAAGGLEESLETINSSLEGQEKLLSGNISAALTTLGKAIAPIRLAFVEFAQALLNASQEGGVGLDRLAEAGQRLREALESNPEAINAIGTALSSIASELVAGVAAAVTFFAGAVENLSSGSITQIGQQFQELVRNALGLVAQLGEVATVLGEIAGVVGIGAVDAFNDLTPALGAAVDFLGAVVAAIQPLLSNSELLSAAIQVLVLRMTALQGIALARSIAALGPAFLSAAGATSTAAGAMTAFTASVVAAAAPLAVLAAAIAAVKFIKFTRDLKVANDNLDAYISQIDAATGTGLKLAQSLSNLGREIAESGGEATDEQIRKLEEYKKLAGQQIDELKGQINEIQSFQPQNDAQRNSQAALVGQLEQTISALESQVEKAGETLGAAAADSGENTGKSLTGSLASSLESGQDAIEDAVSGIEETLSKLSDANGDVLKQIETDALNAKAAILEAGGGDDQIVAAEEASLKKRVAVNKQYLGELKDLYAQTDPNSEEAGKVAAQITDIEQALAQDRVAAAQAAVDAQKKAEEDRLKAAKEAEEQRVQAAKDAGDEIKAQRATEAEAAEAEFGEQNRQQAATFAEQQRSIQEAFQDAQRDKSAAFQKQQQADADSFRNQQESKAEAFQKQQQAERDRANREFDALGAEVERRVQLEQAGTIAERKQLEEQFEEERQLLQERRRIEQEVLNDQGSVLSAADQAGELEDSPLEQARADFEARLQEEAAAFQEAQQAETKAFQEGQTLEAETFEAEQREIQRAFEEEQRSIQADFEQQQRDTEAAFKQQQRQLDEASAKRIKQLIESARGPQIAGARRDGGPVVGGQPYLVGEAGPEIITPTRNGWVHTAQETAALMQPAALELKSQALSSTRGLEQRLDQVIALLESERRVQMGPQSFTFVNEPNPHGAAVGIQMEQLAALVRRRG